MTSKLNILLVIETSGPGGAETVVQRIAMNLDRSLFNPTVILLRPGWFHGHLLEHGIDARVIHSRRSWDLSFIYRLVRACRELRVDVIHSHLSGANLYSALAGAALRIPTIATFHNEFVMPGRSERYIALKSLLVRQLAAKTVLVADYMKQDYMEKGGFPLNKLTTIYNGVNMPAEEPEANLTSLRTELGLKDDDLVIGNVANLRTPKGHSFLIDAAGIVCRDKPRAKFLLIGEEGDGKLKTEIEIQIDSLGLADSVKLLGFRNDITQLLYLMDIFILSSVSEGLPLSVAEAMAASKPVVATKVGGLPEIVVDGQTGYLVDPGNPSALADRIKVLLQDRVLRDRMGKKARELAVSKFSLKAMIDSYQNLYRELCL